MTDDMLRGRIAALERAIADLHEQRRRDRRRPVRAALAAASFAITTTLGATWVLGAADRESLEVGPKGVVVLNENGRPAITLQALPGAGGRIVLFNNDGARVAQVVTSSGGCCGRVEVFDTSHDDARAILGVSPLSNSGALRLTNDDDQKGIITAFGVSFGTEDGQVRAWLGDPLERGEFGLRTSSGSNALSLTSEGENGLIRTYHESRLTSVLGSSGDIGMLRLNGPPSSHILAQGDGKLALFNAAGTEVMAVGANKDGGYLVASNSAGAQAATMSVGADGSGLSQLWKAGNELAVILGTTQGRGDLCANGQKGKVCLGMIAARSLIPY